MEYEYKQNEKKTKNQIKLLKRYSRARVLRQQTRPLNIHKTGISKTRK